MLSMDETPMKFKHFTPCGPIKRRVGKRPPQADFNLLWITACRGGVITCIFIIFD